MDFCVFCESLNLGLQTVITVNPDGTQQVADIRTCHECGEAQPTPPAA